MGWFVPDGSCSCNGCCSIVAEVDGCYITLHWSATGVSATINTIGAVALSGSITILHEQTTYTLSVTQADDSIIECSISVPGCFDGNGDKILSAIGSYTDFVDYDITDSSIVFCDHMVYGGGTTTVYVIRRRETLVGSTPLNHSFNYNIEYLPSHGCHLVDLDGIPVAYLAPDGVVQYNQYLGQITHLEEIDYEYALPGGGSEYHYYTCERVFDVYSKIEWLSGDPPRLTLIPVSSSGSGYSHACGTGGITFFCSNNSNIDFYWKGWNGVGAGRLNSGDSAGGILKTGKFTWLLDTCSISSSSSTASTTSSDPSASAPLATTYVSNLVGPGTDLKNMISWFIWDTSATECNSCINREHLMNLWGKQGCRDNIELILDWLQESAAKRRLPFIRSLVKLVVLRVC